MGEEQRLFAGGNIISHYRLLDKLGGGMGVVYEAEDLTRGHTKILDFGLAKALDPVTASSVGTIRESPLPDSPTLTSMATQAGMILGTVAYMSPEQARGEELDARTDLFSFGCVLYEMAAGRHAFEGTTSAVIVNAILSQQPLPARELNPALPPKLEQVMLKALEKDP